MDALATGQRPVTKPRKEHIIIRQLEQLHLEESKKLEAAKREWHALRARDTALSAIVSNLDALLQAAGKVADDHAGSKDRIEWMRSRWRESFGEAHASRGSGGGASGTSNGSSATAAAASLSGSGGDSGSATVSPGGLGDGSSSTPSTSAAAAEAAAAAVAAPPAPPDWLRHIGPASDYASLTAADVASRVADFVRACGVDAPRIRDAAPDAAAAEARITERLGKLMALSAALIQANPHALGESATLRLDTLEPFPASEAPGADHWDFVLKAARLTAEQEPPLRVFFDMYRARLAEMTAKLEELSHKKASQPADDTASQHEILDALQRHQSEWTFTTVAFPNALYSDLLSPLQAASLWVASYPYVPQVLVLSMAFDRAQAAKSSGTTGGSSHQGASQGGSGQTTEAT